MEILFGILIPFLGTTLGSACVLFMKKSLGVSVQRALAGFAAGVMVAASIWSLLIPAIEQAKNMGKLSFLPAFIGFWFGVLFLLMLDRLIPHLHIGSDQAEGPKSKLGRTTMMVLAVTLHNIPEGMAVGVMYAGFLAGNTQITAEPSLCWNAFPATFRELAPPPQHRALHPRQSSKDTVVPESRAVPQGVSVLRR